MTADHLAALGMLHVILALVMVNGRARILNVRLYVFMLSARPLLTAGMVPLFSGPQSQFIVKRLCTIPLSGAIPSNVQLMRIGHTLRWGSRRWRGSWASLWSRDRGGCVWRKRMWMAVDGGNKRKWVNGAAVGDGDQGDRERCRRELDRRQVNVYAFLWLYRLRRCAHRYSR